MEGLRAGRAPAGRGRRRAVLAAARGAPRRLRWARWPTATATASWMRRSSARAPACARSRWRSWSSRVTAAAQAVVFVASGSVALLADLIHNAGDAATAIPLGIAFVLRSERGRAPRRPRGRRGDLRLGLRRRASRPIDRLFAPAGRRGASALWRSRARSASPATGWRRSIRSRAGRRARQPGADRRRRSRPRRRLRLARRRRLGRRRRARGADRRPAHRPGHHRRHPAHHLALVGHRPWT